MKHLNRKILYVDLEERKYEITSHSGLHTYVGGIGLSLALLTEKIDQEALIFSIGPLNGYFPFVSKTCLTAYSDALDLKTAYLGGSFSSRIKFSGYDALVFTGECAQPMYLVIGPEGVRFADASAEFEASSFPGKSSKITFDEEEGYFLDGYFKAPEDFLDRELGSRNVVGICVNSGHSIKVQDITRYENLFNEILSKFERLKALPSDKPSCVGCSLGCSSSKIGESEGNTLTHCLVACEFASDLYSDLGIVFSCLNTLGYDYTHEDLEKIPSMIDKLFTSLGEANRE